MDPIEFDFMMGVDLLSDERRLMKNHVRKLQNLVPIAPGLLAKRKGTVGYLSPFSASLGYQVPQILKVITSDLLPAYVLCAREMDAYSTVLTGSAAGTPVSDYSWPQIPPRIPCIVEFLNKAYVFPGTGAGRSGALLQESGGTVTLDAFDFNGTGNGYAPAVACVYRQRMAMADFGRGKENWLVLSDDYDPVTIGSDTLTASNGRALKVGIDGERITALVDVMLTAVGSPAQSALLILKEHSAYLMTGELDQTGGGTDDAVINEISFKAGCVGWTTVVKTPHGVFWAGHDDVWFFRAGQVPLGIGRKILPALGQTGADFRYKWHAAYHDGFLRIAIGGEGQGMGHDDPCGEQWWLDLRDGPPQSWEEARWYGPMIFKLPVGANTASIEGTFTMSAESRPGEQPTLYGVAAINNSLQQLYSFDAQTGYDEAGRHTTLALDDQWDNEIEIKLHTGTYDFGAPTKQKTVMRVEFDARASFCAQTPLYAVIDGGVGGQIELVSSAGDSLQFSRNGFVAGVDTLDDTHITREFESLVAYPNGGSRLAFKQLKLELEENQGYIVDADNDIFRFSWNSFDYVATLTQNRYSNLKTFLDELIRAMEAATNGSADFSHNVASQTRASTLAISVATGTWAPQFSVNRSTRIIGAQLGFNTGGHSSESASHTTDATTRWRESPNIEIGSMILTVRLIPRRAT